MMIQKNIFLLFAIIIAVYFCAIGVDTMDVDASQYAAISREMKESGRYLQVYEQGKDYLDKPPFLFWISSLSMNLFGENNLGFKFPSILFAILAVFATYRFAKLFYDKTLAVISAIVLASCQAVFLITNDIRTDTILMSWVIIAIWQIAEWMQSKKTIHFILGAAAIGAGMVTKGPIALFVPIFAFGSHFVLQRKFSYLFKPVYLLGLITIAIVLIPMSIGLYQQYDLHPEKTVNGLKNVSGLRFFYWTQSFGRITGENVWNNNAPFSFLFENLLWGMLPWTLFFISGLVNDLIQIIRKKLIVAENEEFLTTGGFVLAYCSLGISKYQLPHYIYVVLPFIAIITAKMIYAIFWQQKFQFLKKMITPVQWLVCITLLIAPVIIIIYSFPSNSIWTWLIPVLTATTVLTLFLNKAISKKLFSISLALIIGLNVFLSLWFYPQVLKYQAGNVAGRYIAKQRIDREKFYIYRFQGNNVALHFYSNRIVRVIDSINNLSSETYLLTMDEGLEILKNSGRNFEILKQGLDYHVTALTGKFLNKETRDQQCKNYYIIKLN
ncbi:MAG: glycosyltransferase family 39 protein [Chitinophagaceae bacterium]|nr:glycosyltransferase family 39 protein [Chitinophagaceae bacterium]